MASELKTEHPYVIRVEGLRGGQPVIKNTGLEVALIVKLNKMGDGVDDIATSYPNLTPAAIRDALSYYYDHQEEMDKEIADQELEAVLQRNRLYIDSQGRILPLGS